MNNKIEATVLIQVNEGSSDQFESMLFDFERETNNEKGCVEFRFFRDVVDSNRFVLWEIFVDQNALSEHMELSHTKEIFGKGLIKSTTVIKHQKVT